MALFKYTRKELTHTMTPSWRYVLAWMGCFGLMNVYFCRINLSMAMVAMVGVDPPGPANSSCGMSGKGEERVGRVGEFNWTKPEQGLVTGSYFWGYTACQVLLLKMTFKGRGCAPTYIVFSLVTPSCVRSIRN